MRIHHLAMRTKDLARLEAFYSGLLGLEVIRGTSSDGRVWLRAGDAILMLELAEPGEPEIPANCKEFVAFAISANERQHWRNAIEQSGWVIEVETPHTLYFRDPDGRRVGLSSYAHGPQPGGGVID
jgi:catechol 2,3-dioxygenase-like lactoylglutathione lyase family enzyme